MKAGPDPLVISSRSLLKSCHSLLQLPHMIRESKERITGADALRSLMTAISRRL